MAVRKKKVADALASWITLNDALSDLTEEEVLHALAVESQREGGARPSFVRRLDQRRRGIKIGELREELEGDGHEL